MVSTEIASVSTASIGVTDLNAASRLGLATDPAACHPPSAQESLPHEKRVHVQSRCVVVGVTLWEPLPEPDQGAVVLGCSSDGRWAVSMPDILASMPVFCCSCLEARGPSGAPIFPSPLGGPCQATTAITIIYSADEFCSSGSSGAASRACSRRRSSRTDA